MQRVRILTGNHAGATIDLSYGKYMVGPDDEFEISISDWTSPTLELTLNENGELTGRWQRAKGGTADRQHRFLHFAPRAFGDIVLCAGPVDTPWPSDLRLLDQTFSPTPKRVARWAGSGLRKLAASTLIGGFMLMLCVAGGIAWMGAPAAQAQRESVDALMVRMHRALAPTGASALQVTPQGESVLIHGMVDDDAQARAVNSALDALATPRPVLRRLAVATSVAASIQFAVGIPDAQVKYLGQGAFSLHAATTDTQAAQQAVDRVRADLGPSVTRIDAKLDAIEKPATEMRILSSLKDDGISVVQTRDGVKHLVVIEPAHTVSVGKALSLRPTGAH